MVNQRVSTKVFIIFDPISCCCLQKATLKVAFHFHRKSLQILPIWGCLSVNYHIIETLYNISFPNAPTVSMVYHLESALRFPSVRVFSHQGQTWNRKFWINKSFDPHANKQQTCKQFCWFPNMQIISECRHREQISDWPGHSKHKPQFNVHIFSRHYDIKTGSSCFLYDIDSVKNICYQGKHLFCNFPYF